MASGAEGTAGFLVSCSCSDSADLSQPVASSALPPFREESWQRLSTRGQSGDSAGCGSGADGRPPGAQGPHTAPHLWP